MTDALPLSGADVQNSESSECPFTSEHTTEKLTVGLLSHYQPDLTRVKSKLDELTKKQVSLIEKLAVENNRLTACQETYNVQDVFTKLKLYQNKLILIKKEMSHIHERTAKVKKRALKLQQVCQKEALMREQRKEEQLQREQMLIAKPGPSRRS
ncbi:biogenesis of lysosome-related organelles complex 1 subunit 6-like [Ischnura elegans]|uniref:biogenesis of lysosome-related organelles complex 1 subunit 6-like n=1 Tax=Ischnura elegans TaxID=197161 RepID=UPI001ED8A3FE|nr:biogenesis of lysosome-related organelles complex 1 subunit 6-like [Ischnura elegans]